MCVGGSDVHVYLDTVVFWEILLVNCVCCIHRMSTRPLLVMVKYVPLLGIQPNRGVYVAFATASRAHARNAGHAFDPVLCHAVILGSVRHAVHCGGVQGRGCRRRYGTVHCFGGPRTGPGGCLACCRTGVALFAFCIGWRVLWLSRYILFVFGHINQSRE